MSDAVTGGVRASGAETIVDGDLANLQAGGVFTTNSLISSWPWFCKWILLIFSSVSLAFILNGRVT
ncbi:hypothetical protein M5585_15535 [Serratia ureilytica]